ncbi:hypothetical protein DL240_09840 [Lujinxingia litoralis]|uniref:LTD domain-containing protein n=1 Tax=Lujinxingia litoralis TaxID=2211119 RepID=A0A328CA79_9DELT|nr:hypothetical protein [Lujinxingia litoralis]RAL22147.1 hypothetical protein DL240_09840 [Lujinxingia litoralis]
MHELTPNCSRPSSGRALAALLLGALVHSGCNLAFDLQDYPYRAPEPDADLHADTELDASHPDGDVDAPPARAALVFSELMIHTEPPPGESRELGEYIEILNQGEGAIDPRVIVIEILETNERIEIDRVIDTAKERAIVEALQPIGPGERFVFYRRNNAYYDIKDTLDPTASYEFGRWGRPVGLSNFSRSMRMIELEGDFGFVIHDEVAWRDGALIDPSGASTASREIRENVAFGLHSEATTGRDPANFCYHRETFSSGPLLGSPGQPTPASCR